MANPLRLQVSDLPSDPQPNATVSPARGAEMRNFLQTRLLQKNRAPPLVHSWDFYHDRQDRSPAATAAAAPAPNTSKGSTGASDDHQAHYEARLEHLAVINDVKQFWNVFNNFPFHNLSLRDSIHLFHHAVLPVWEHPRNAQGGSWTFRVPKSQSADFWREICLMAIGEQLQEAVTDDSRAVFRDDICGVSLAVRANSCLVQIWNRDGEHEEGIARIRDVVLSGLSEELRPKEGNFYYKKHAEHAGFSASSPQLQQQQQAWTESGSIPARPQIAISSVGPTMSIDAVLAADGA